MLQHAIQILAACLAMSAMAGPITLQQPAVMLDRELIPLDRFGRFSFALRFTEPTPGNTAVTVLFGPVGVPAETQSQIISVPAGVMEVPVLIANFTLLAALESGADARISISGSNAGPIAEPRSARFTYAKPPADPTTGYSIAVLSQPVSPGLDALVEIRRRGALPSGDSVRLSTRDGTAKSGQDYQAISETLFFEAGQTALDVAVPTTVHQEFKGERSFDVILTDASPGTVVDDQSTGILLAGDVAWQFLTRETIEEGQRSALLHLYFSAGPVRVQTEDVTATAGRDYLPIDQVLSEGNNELEITLIDDGLVEGTETFDLVFSNPEDPSQVVRKRVRIEDNEIPLSVDESFQPAINLNGQSGYGVMGGVASDGTLFVASLDDETLFHLDTDGGLLGKALLRVPLDFRGGSLLTKSDGQLLLGGAYPGTGPGWNAPTLVRLRPDGTVDPTFQFGLPGTRVKSMAEHIGTTVLVIVTDTFRDIDQLCRIHADGSLDEAFPNWLARQFNGPFAEQHFEKVVSAPNGQFWVEVTERFPRQVMRRRVELHEADGSLVAADWSPAEGFAPSHVLADGRRYYAVEDLTEKGWGGTRLERWFPDGSLDRSFLTSAYDPPQFKFFGVQSNGQPVLMGLDQRGQQCTAMLRFAAQTPTRGTRLRWEFQSTQDRGLADNLGFAAEGVEFTRPLIRLGDTSDELRVAIKTQPGTALDGIDYLGADESLLLPPFAVETNVTATPLADDVLEEFETFSLSFAPEFATSQTGGNRLTVGISDRTRGVKLYVRNPPFTNTRTVQVWYQVNVPLPVSVVVEESTDLTNWTPILQQQGVTQIDNWALVLNPNEPRRFVRIRIK